MKAALFSTANTIWIDAFDSVMLIAAQAAYCECFDGWQAEYLRWLQCGFRTETILSMLALYENISPADAQASMVHFNAENENKWRFCRG